MNEVHCGAAARTEQQRGTRASSWQVQLDLACTQQECVPAALQHIWMLTCPQSSCGAS